MTRPRAAIGVAAAVALATAARSRPSTSSCAAAATRSFCFIPDRAGSPPHVAKGMLSEVTVE